MENIEEVRALKPRYVVVQLGENSDAVAIGSGRLTREYGELLQAIYDRGAEEVFCVSDWDEASFEDPHNAAILKAVRKFPRVHWVDITGLAKHPENYADTVLYKNEAVRWHPGDKGMQGIAEALAAVILEQR